jgi:hypothetical protein
VIHALARSITTTAPMTAADPRLVTYPRTRFSVQWNTDRGTRKPFSTRKWTSTRNATMLKKAGSSPLVCAERPRFRHAPR